jgi:hypothetical protein
MLQYTHSKQKVEYKMGKETKAQRQDRGLQAARQERTAERIEQYLPKLMTALEEATTKSNYELEVRDSLFSLRDRDSRYCSNLVTLSAVYSQSNWDQLDTLVWDLQSKAEARVEQERKQAMKQVALAKLTKEEKELLNLE